MNPRPSMLGLLFGLPALLALLLFYLYTKPSVQTPLHQTNAKELSLAKEGPVEVSGVIRYSLGRTYQRSFSVLGKARTDTVVLIPITERNWQKGEPISGVLLVSSLPKKDTPEVFSVFRGVKLATVEPNMVPDLILVKNAALVELSEKKMPILLIASFSLSILVFFLLGGRAVWRYLHRPVRP